VFSVTLGISSVLQGDSLRWSPELVIINNAIIHKRKRFTSIYALVDVEIIWFAEDFEIGFFPFGNSG
jgi:hypothetical protein